MSPETIKCMRSPCLALLQRLAKPYSYSDVKPYGNTYTYAQFKSDSETYSNTEGASDAGASPASAALKEKRSVTSD